MTDYQNLHYSTKNHIAYITIDRPKVLNALNISVMDELRRAERFVSGHGFSRAAMPY
jgi:enoyl-CoA hydratase/carnithine racemase